MDVGHNLDWLALPLFFKALLVITLVELELGKDGVINFLRFVFEAEFCPKSTVFPTFNRRLGVSLNKSEFLLHLSLIDCFNVLFG